MPTALLNNETIPDLQGNPLRADGASVLKALDRMLTVGAYYSREHSQYLQAAEDACRIITQAIAPRPCLALEIAATGLLIEGQTIDPRHRNARQLHDLLVPLNIARLELHAALTPADLRQALSALHDHRLGLGQSLGFREITIENLPATVCAASRRVGGGDEADGAVTLDDLLGDWSEESSPGEGSPRDGEREKLSQELKALIAALLENLQAMPGPAGPRQAVHPLTAADVATITGKLRQLLEETPDVAELARLISQARSALTLSHDPAQTGQALELLRRELKIETKAADAAPASRVLREECRLSVEQLACAVDELVRLAEPVPPVRPSAQADHLRVVFGLLAAADDGPPSASALSALQDAWSAGDGAGHGDVDVDGTRAVTASFVAGVATGDPERADRLVPPVLAIVRRERPDLVAPLWWEILAGAGKATADDSLWPTLWPHLVNDLLLGLDPAPHPLAAPLCLKAGELPTAEALELAPRLATLSAMGRETLAGDLLAVPLARTLAIHAALMSTPAADRHGVHLHHLLSRRSPDALTRVLMSAVGSYQPEHRELFAALLREADRDHRSRHLDDLSARALQHALTNLLPARRTEPWVAAAIEWLRRLAPEAASTLLARIRSERRLLFRRAWPSACRRAASGAQAAANDSGEA